MLGREDANDRGVDFVLFVFVFVVEVEGWTWRPFRDDVEEAGRGVDDGTVMGVTL